MSRHLGRIRLHSPAASLLLVLLCSSCAAVEQYSRRAGQSACSAFDRCAVYENVGEHVVACFQPAGEVPEAFAGDSGWPLSSAKCQS
jgi:hypothetical protein